MSNSIGWCDCTVNPIVGCTKCSPGCENCYAERFAARLAKNPATAKKYAGVVDERGRWTGKISEPDWSCFEKLPKSPRRVFVGSMTDIFFDEHAPHLPKLFDMMASMPQHKFLLLTKRPENMRVLFDAWNVPYIPSNIWLGVTVCNQAEAKEKIPILMRIPARMRFVSIEPMLAPIDLDSVPFKYSDGFFGSALRWYHLPHGSWSKDYPALNWVICGGESGPGARQMHSDWVRSLRDQCVEAGVPFYFKGWGRYKPIPEIQNGMVWREFPAQEGADAR